MATTDGKGNSSAVIAVTKTFPETIADLNDVTYVYAPDIALALDMAQRYRDIGNTVTVRAQVRDSALALEAAAADAADAADGLGFGGAGAGNPWWQSVADSDFAPIAAADARTRWRQYQVRADEALRAYAVPRNAEERPKEFT